MRSLIAPILVTGLILCAASSDAEIFLADDFNDGVINTSLWQVQLPFGQSSVTEANGYMTTTGRGTLGTVSGFNGPILVSGDFTMLNSLEQFKVAVRSDLTTYSGFAEITGLAVAFATDQQALRIDWFSNTEVLLQGIQPFAFVVGQTYHYEITDTGSAVSVSVDGNPILNVTSSLSMGNHVAFFSREFSETSSQFDNVVIASIPEPSSTTLLAGAGIVGMIFRSSAKRTGRT